MTNKFNIIGLGEILWDQLPDGKQLGGAPANFAYAASQLGNRGIVLSRVGDDESGRAILDELKSRNLSTDNIQIDAKNPTGVVKVSLNDEGQPSYEIVENAAWDFLELSADWRKLAQTADAVCFGSLAQRSAVSQKTIRGFIDLTKNLRIFDVNLRQQFFSPKVLRSSLNLANVVKLNHEELPVIAEIFDLQTVNPIAAAQRLLAQFGLNMICVTRGANGSILVTKKEVSENAGLKIQVKDTIGAGDAFTAALTHGILHGWELDKINEFANKIGAFVASQRGAMPNFPEGF
ncbi:MAG TPA: carbohydrate kinase [Pyrinomonadaceae bacterium]|nr:carbohydrate kinase [Pyrinomonadaceae bacterium]